MNERRRVTRHDNSEMPSNLSSVYLTLHDGTDITAEPVNISSSGMRLTIPTDEFYDENNIWKGHAVIVNFPNREIDAPAVCMDVERKSNGTLSIGVYFTNHYNQYILKGIILHKDETSGMAE